MVKRVNLVDREALVAGKVLETIRVAGLDGMEFAGWLIERYGSNEKVRKAIEEAVKGIEDKEVTLYVPEHNPVSMVLLPKFNVIKFLEKSFQKVLLEMHNTNFPFDTSTYDDWANEVDDSISNLLEALFYCMVKNCNVYKIEKSHSCWKYVLGLAKMYYESPNWEEDSYRVFALDMAIGYVAGGGEQLKRAIIRDFENFDSLAHRLAIRIGAHFNESSITDPESFYKDEKGWNLLFSTQVRKKGEAKFQDITFAFTLNDNSNDIEMMVMFDNEKGKSVAEIVSIVVDKLIKAGVAEKYETLKIASDKVIPTIVFNIKHKGVTDVDFLTDIEEVRNVCIVSALDIAS